MHLIIDIGNTRTKAAVFKDLKLIYTVTTDADNFFETLRKILNRYDIRHGILSSVGRFDETDRKKLSKMLSFIVLNQKTPVPFNNLYDSPETLGVDRIALMAAAATIYSGLDVLVIDAGTSITYDLMSSKGKYYGGSISPGIKMRYKALSTFTSKLPYLQKPETIPVKGNNTQNAIHRGVLNGTILEIEGIIAQYQEENPKLTVVLTGGDTNFLVKNLKSTIFANPNFLLEGLNRILIYNIDE